MSWTDESIQELTRLWQAGLSASDIGKQLGMSKNAVVGKAHRLKLPSRPSPIKHTSATAQTAGAGRAASRKAGIAKPAKAAKNGAPAKSAPASADAAAATSPARHAGGAKLVQRRQAAVRAVTRGRGREAASTSPERGGRGKACLWPIGDPGDSDFHFCGEEPVPGKPYCAEHAARAYITRTRERGRYEREEEEAA